ncbi:putative protein arginine N-methyltransferase 6 [Glycine max]|nr:putative protein arginine N-methyltransferase 6 [Glycine max]
MQQPEKQINAPAGMPLPERRRRRRSSGICATSGVRVQPQEEQQQVATRGTVLTDSDQFYFNWYAHIDVHEEMIKDRVRTDAYKNAIMRHKDFIRDKVVLDVGCGTGILAIFCAQAGARRVYAVEASNIALQTIRVVEANNLLNIITVLHGRVEDVEIGEKVDVIISEWMGYMLLCESMLGSVITARDRWLKPGGLVLPSKATLYMAPFTHAKRYWESIDFWRSVYGINRYGYDSSSLDTREEDRNYKYYRRIQKQEVKEALKRMSNGKAVGPDNIPIEVWKTLGDRGLEWLTKLFNEIMRSKRMPEEWRRSTLVPIYKNKGDIQNCANYRGIKLMSHTMKLWERVIERRLRKETQVTENQFGFMPGRSTMEAIYLLRRVMEQYRMAQQDLHLIFIDLEKAYDRVPREILWKALEKKGVRVAYIRAIQDMYDRVSTSVRTQGGESDDFPITIGLHQGSTLSPYLFTLILDVLTEQIQEIAPRCMLFADDIVLLGESREELNERLETWRRALETHGFRLSRSKSEYMECKFNKRMRVSNSEVKIGDHITPQVTRFKYLGSVIQDDGEIEGDVNHRIQAGWMKWRKASGVLCDAKVPIKLKGKFYRTAVRPAILYGTECWTVKSQHENRVGVAEMRMLRWMCGKTRQDKIRNEAIRERVGVAPIVEKMVENRLRWFGHVERRPVDSVVRRVDQMERRQTIRGRGRPKKTIREVIKKDLEINGLDRMSAMVPLAKQCAFVGPSVETITSENVLAWPQVVKCVNCSSVTIPELESITTRFKFNSLVKAPLHGFAFWFDVEFTRLSPEPISFQLSTSLVDDHPVGSQRQDLRDPTLLLSTAPEALPTHWQQTLIYFYEPIELEQDQLIEGKVTLSQSQENHRNLNIELVYATGGQSYVKVSVM